MAWPGIPQGQFNHTATLKRYLAEEATRKGRCVKNRQRRAEGDGCGNLQPSPTRSIHASVIQNNPRLAHSCKASRQSSKHAWCTRVGFGCPFCHSPTQMYRNHVGNYFGFCTRLDTGLLPVVQVQVRPRKVQDDCQRIPGLRSPKPASVHIYTHKYRYTHVYIYICVYIHFLSVCTYLYVYEHEYHMCIYVHIICIYVAVHVYRVYSGL